MDGNVYAISITTGADGEQVPGIVFREPEQGAVYERGYVFGFKDGGVFDPTNDDGKLPHRERTQGAEEDLGLTWQFPK